MCCANRGKHVEQCVILSSVDRYVQYVKLSSVDRYVQSLEVLSRLVERVTCVVLLLQVIGTLQACSPRTSTVFLATRCPFVQINGLSRKAVQV